MKIIVNSFGQVKDFHDQKFEIEVADSATIETLFEKLVEMRPESKNLLENCRIAVDDIIIYEKEFELKNNQEVFIMPPFSGG